VHKEELHDLYRSFGSVMVIEG